MWRSLFLFLLATLSFPAFAQPLPTLQGDAQAVARIERMFALMGGRPVWAGAQSMYVRYRQLSISAQRPGEGEERAWRDVTRPRQRFEWVRTDHRGQTTSWARIYDGTTGWRREGREMVDATQEERNQGDNWWPLSFYTMLKRLAAGDPTLHFRFTPPHRIDVTGPAGASAGWYDIDEAGTLVRWGRSDPSGDLSYIYGPVRRMGDISFPAWGTTSNGNYRFEYLDVILSRAPLPEAVFHDPATPPPAELRLR